MPFSSTIRTITEDMKMGQMYNPPHPGEILKADVLPELGLSLRLADWLPPSAESWLRMQAAFDLWKASKKRRPKIKPAPDAARAA